MAFARFADRVANAFLHLDGGRPTRLGGPLQTQGWLRKNYPAFFQDSPRTGGHYVADPTPWPDPSFGPEVPGNHAFVYNEKTVEGVEPQKVLGVIRNAASWSKVCDNLTDANIEGGATLALGSRFNWTTFGTNNDGEIVELKEAPLAPLAITWRARDSHTHGKNVDVMHRYLLYAVRDPAGRVGTRIVTEESQRGSLTRPSLMNPNQEKMMLAGHQYLLDCIAKAARADVV